MSFIWAARGREWGFHFLRTGGWEDPLPPYEVAFGDGIGSDTIRRFDEGLALRLTDPEHRRDRSGRPIVHDFVLYGELASLVVDAAAGLRVVWPLVADDYAGVWELSEAPRVFGA